VIRTVLAMVMCDAGERAVTAGEGGRLAASHDVSYAAELGSSEVLDMEADADTNPAS
jgi:hypothetical protein